MITPSRDVLQSYLWSLMIRWWINWFNINWPPTRRSLPHADATTSGKTGLTVHLDLIFHARSCDLWYYVPFDETINEDENEDYASCDGSFSVPCHGELLRFDEKVKMVGTKAWMNWKSARYVPYLILASNYWCALICYLRHLDLKIEHSWHPSSHAMLRWYCSQISVPGCTIHLGALIYSVSDILSPRLASYLIGLWIAGA